MLSFLLLLLFTVVSEGRDDLFKVYWNAPTAKCLNDFNVNIPLDQFGIIHNDRQAFVGDKISTFYEYKVGKWPYFRKYNASHPVNGGLPQNADLNEHLRLIEELINNTFPDPNFDGPAMFDLEEWRPMYDLNWGVKQVYRNESEALAVENDPSLTPEEAVDVGAMEFDDAAREIMVGTLRLAKRLRPRAKWGYYGFPMCNYDAGRNGDAYCSKGMKAANDKLSWLYDEQTGFFPSIYFSNQHKIHYIKRLYIHAILAETRRMQEVSHKQPIYAYTKIEYDPYKPTAPFYDKRDLCNSLIQLTDFGAAGALIWSTDSKLSTQRCQNIADHIGAVSGPYIRLVQSRNENCSNKLCSGRGRCIKTTPPSRCDLTLDPSDYVCECDDGWSGPYCKASSNGTIDETTNVNFRIKHNRKFGKIVDFIRKKNDHF